MVTPLNPKLVEAALKVSPVSGRPVEPTHIEDLRPGDVVLYQGKEKTVGIKDVKSCRFMGISLFGYNYKCGSEPVLVVDYSSVR